MAVKPKPIARRIKVKPSKPKPRQITGRLYPVVVPFPKPYIDPDLAASIRAGVDAGVTGFTVYQDHLKNWCVLSQVGSNDGDYATGQDLIALMDDVLGNVEFHQQRKQKIYDDQQARLVASIKPAYKLKPALLPPIKRKTFGRGKS